MRHSSSQARRTTRRYAQFGTRRHVSIVLINQKKNQKVIRVWTFNCSIWDKYLIAFKNSLNCKFSDDFGVCKSLLSLFFSFWQLSPRLGVFEIWSLKKSFLLYLSCLRRNWHIDRVSVADHLLHPSLSKISVPDEQKQQKRQ